MSRIWPHSYGLRDVVNTTLANMPATGRNMPTIKGLEKLAASKRYEIAVSTFRGEVIFALRPAK